MEPSGKQAKSSGGASGPGRTTPISCVMRTSLTTPRCRCESRRLTPSADGPAPGKRSRSATHLSRPDLSPSSRNPPVSRSYRTQSTEARGGGDSPLGEMARHPRHHPRCDVADVTRPDAHLHGICTSLVAHISPQSHRKRRSFRGGIRSTPPSAVPVHCTTASSPGL